MLVQKATEASALGMTESAVTEGALHRQQAPPGFRHFLGTPNASQRFKAYGIDPLDAPEHRHKVRGLMNRLSRRMDARLRWPAHGDATIERLGKSRAFPRVTPTCCNSWPTISCTRRYRFRSRAALSADTANARRTALRLETLFGSGPVGSPFVYAQDTPNDERRTKLRLGRMRWKDRDVEPGCPFRDIARTPAENVTGIDRSIAGNARRADRSADCRSPQRRSRHHVAADGAVRAAA